MYCFAGVRKHIQYVSLEMDALLSLSAASITALQLRMLHDTASVSAAPGFCCPGAAGGVGPGGLSYCYRKLFRTVANNHLFLALFIPSKRVLERASQRHRHRTGNCLRHLGPRGEPAWRAKYNNLGTVALRPRTRATTSSGITLYNPMPSKVI